MVKDAYSRAFVLLSGGIDSATALYRAHNEHMRVTAISIDYGQRHKREITSAAALAQAIHAQHYVHELGDLLAGKDVMLTDRNVDIPKVSYDDIKGISPTYVPFRNGTMLAVLAAQAMKYVNHVQTITGVSADDPNLKDLVTLYFGAHAEDAKNWAYPDCTPEFVGAMANAIYIGSYQTVRLVAPYVYSSKADIIREGMRLSVPYAMTWSCYSGGELHCGVCPTCRARKDAFLIVGVADPTAYNG
jgi:7-cyano-7-deazaguanine synthase